MPAYLTTIREQIEDLNPKEYRRMQANGELDQVLEEYLEQVKYARTAAARAARKQADLDDPNEPAASMNMAAMMAQEFAMAEIMEELDLLYGPQTTESPTPTSMEELDLLYGSQTTESPTPTRVDTKSLITLSPGEKVPEGYVRLSDLDFPIYDLGEVEDEAMLAMLDRLNAEIAADKKETDKT